MARIIPQKKQTFKIVFDDFFEPPVVVEDEDQFKQVIARLKEEKRFDEAKRLTKQWVNLKKDRFKINYHGKFLNLGQKTAIMGILNATPDSFSDGGQFYNDIDKAVKRISQMLEEGADIIDIGGESTRPGATPVSEEEEIKRVVPIIKEARNQLGNHFLISIDTYKAKVAEEALKAGADIVNDISAMSFDKNMADVVAQFDCPVIMNHIKGTPQNMQKKPYYDDVVVEIIQFLEEHIEYGIKKGIREDRFIIDPGIGFGKQVEHNVEIIKRLEEFKVLGFPILIGISRKSFIGIILKNLLGKSEYPPKERLYGSLSATAVAVLNGAHIVRVHDVKETAQFLTILDTIRGYRLV